jgi:hypothetical protein
LRGQAEQCPFKVIGNSAVSARPTSASRRRFRAFEGRPRAARWQWLSSSVASSPADCSLPSRGVRVSAGHGQAPTRNLSHRPEQTLLIQDRAGGQASRFLGNQASLTRPDRTISRSRLSTVVIRSQRRAGRADDVTDATSRASPARAAEGGRLGWRAARRGQEARRRAAEPTASASAATQRRLARTCDVARARGPSFSPLDARLSDATARSLGVSQDRFPRRPFLGSERSHSPRRRRRRGERSGSGTPGVGGAMRKGHQPGRSTSREGLEQPISFARAPHAH